MALSSPFLVLLFLFFIAVNRKVQIKEEKYVIYPLKSFVLFLEYILCIYLFNLYVCMCTTCMPSARRAPKIASDIPELELWMPVSHTVDARN